MKWIGFGITGEFTQGILKRPETKNRASAAARIGFKPKFAYLGFGTITARKYGLRQWPKMDM